MATKPSQLSVPLAGVGDAVSATTFNQLADKLSQVREYHISPTGQPSGLSSSTQTFNTTIAIPGEKVQSNNVQTIKNYATILEGSSYIADGAYANRILIPLSPQNILSATEHLANEVQIVNELAALNANCSANYSNRGNNGNNSVRGDNADNSPEWAW